MNPETIGLASSIALIILPHAVALIPGLAGLQGPLGAILKILAGNYKFAANAPADQQDVVTPRP